MKILPINILQNKTSRKQKYNKNQVFYVDNKLEIKDVSYNRFPSFNALRGIRVNDIRHPDVVKNIQPYLSGKIKYTEESAKEFSDYMYNNNITSYADMYVFLNTIKSATNLSFNMDDLNSKLFTNHFLINLMQSKRDSLYLGQIMLGTNGVDVNHLFELLPKCFLQENEEFKLEDWIHNLFSMYCKSKPYKEFAKQELQAIYRTAGDTENKVILNILNSLISTTLKKDLLGEDYNNSKYAQINNTIEQHNVTSANYEKHCVKQQTNVEDLTSVDYMAKLLSTKEMRIHGGDILKDKPQILLAIPDLIRTKENSEQYDKMLNSLRLIRDIDFNVRDELNISFLEKVLNSENEELFEIIKNKTFIYYSELDDVYNQIGNENLKEQVKKMNMRFPDVEKAVNLSSIQGLELVEKQIASPFFQSFSVLTDIIKKLSLTSPEFRDYFCVRFETQLPNYFRQLSAVYNKQNII